MTQQGFLRIITNPKSVGADVQTMAGAWQQFDKLFQDRRVGFANEPIGIQSEWRTLTQHNTYCNKLWNDAFLAAFAKCLGLEIVTFDTGFRQFPGLACTIL